ncbi:MAG: MFS transporter [Pseudomonadota bacterium]
MAHFRLAFVLIVLLWIAGLAAAGQFSKVTLPFAELRAIYAGSGNHIGWLLSIISLLGALFGAVAGALVGGLGPRRVLIFGLATGGAISLWQALLPAYPLMLASRVVEGVSHLAIVVAAPTLIVQISPDRARGAAMALWSTFFGAAFILTAWIGPPLVRQFGVGGLFAGHGALMLGMAVVLGVLLHRHLSAGPDAKAHDGPEPSVALRPAKVLAQLAHTIRSPAISAPGVGWVFYTMSFVSMFALLPDLLPPESRARAVATWPVITTAVALIGLPLLLRAVSGSVLYMVGFAGAALTVGWALASVLGGTEPSWMTFSLALFLWLGLIQGSAFASVPELNTTPDDQALAYGLLAQTGNIGNLTGTPLFLLVLATGGPTALLAGLTGIYLMALVALWHLRRKRLARPPVAQA